VLASLERRSASAWSEIASLKGSTDSLAGALVCVDKLFSLIDLSVLPQSHSVFGLAEEKLLINNGIVVPLCNNSLQAQIQQTFLECQRRRMHDPSYFTHTSMASRIVKLPKITGIKTGIALITGGLALDSGLLAAIQEEMVAEKVTVTARSHADSIYAGAIGAALWGDFRHSKLAELEAQANA
jgi:hypothetical protein